jgi:hypothetical protein
MKHQIEFRYHPVINEEGKLRMKKYEYILWFQDNQLVDIRNEFHYSVDLKSECWEFFTKKYLNYGKI